MKIVSLFFPAVAMLLMSCSPGNQVFTSDNQISAIIEDAEFPVPRELTSTNLFANPVISTDNVTIRIPDEIINLGEETFTSEMLFDSLVTEGCYTYCFGNTMYCVCHSGPCNEVGYACGSCAGMDFDKGFIKLGENRLGKRGEKFDPSARSQEVSVGMLRIR